MSCPPAALIIDLKALSNFLLLIGTLCDSPELGIWTSERTKILALDGGPGLGGRGRREWRTRHDSDPTSTTLFSLNQTEGVAVCYFGKIR